MSQPDGGNGWSFFAVLDGHGGSQAAKLAAEAMPGILKKHFKGRTAKEGPSPTKVKEAFEEIDHELSLKLGSGRRSTRTSGRWGGGWLIIRLLTTGSM